MESNSRKKPSVSIIIPTYQRPELLVRALDQARAQDYSEVIEIIVTDDSHDEVTKNLVQEISIKDVRVSYVKNTRYERGPSGNKQNGLDHATGAFLAILDDDDELIPTAISDMIEPYLVHGYRHIFANCTRSTDGLMSGKHYGASTEVSYQDILQGKYEGEYFHLFARDLMGDYRIPDDTWVGESILLWRLFQQEGSYYLHKAVRIYHVDSGGNVSDQYLKHAQRTCNTYKYRVDLFGDDLKKYAPTRYQKYAYLAAFFAMVAGNTTTSRHYVSLAWHAGKINLKSIAMAGFILAPFPRRVKVWLYQQVKKWYTKIAR